MYIGENVYICSRILSSHTPVGAVLLSVLQMFNPVGQAATKQQKSTHGLQKCATFGRL